MFDVITDYSGESDINLLGIGNDAVKGLTGNAKFALTTQLADTAAKTGTYEDSLAAVANGNSSMVTQKNTDKMALVLSLKVLGKAVNLLANGDLGKLQTTGLRLVKEPSRQVMTEVVNFKVVSTNIVGNVLVSVDKPTTFSTHGTVFAFWDPAYGVAPADKNKWFQRHANGNSITLTEFLPGVEYLFSAAYKGSDTDALVWSTTITKMLGK